MPIYEYKCDTCGRTLEKRQKFSDAALTVCPYCDGHLEKTISAPAIQFKGGGWYADLYSSSKGKSAPAGDGAAAASGPAEGSTGTSAPGGTSESGGSSKPSDASSGSSSASSTSSSAPAASAAAINK